MGAATAVNPKMMIKANPGNARMVEIAGYVREGAMAYLRQQYSRVGLVFAILVVIFAVLALMGVQNPFVPVAFLTGGFFSGLCGYLGMNTATRASSRTAQGASESLNRGLQVAFRSGAVMGLLLAFGVMHPNAVIMLLIPPIPMKAKWFVIIYGVIELFLGWRGVGNVAHFAHVGGMLWGFLLLHWWKQRGIIRF